VAFDLNAGPKPIVSKFTFEANFENGFQNGLVFGDATMWFFIYLKNH